MTDKTTEVGGHGASSVTVIVARCFRDTDMWKIDVVPGMATQSQLLDRRRSRCNPTMSCASCNHTLSSSSRSASAWTST
jgi:hypothetical protein